MKARYLSTVTLCMNTFFWHPNTNQLRNLMASNLAVIILSSQPEG